MVHFSKSKGHPMKFYIKFMTDKSLSKSLVCIQ